MTTVVGVSFKRAGKTYWFDPDGLEISEGRGLIVETARGIDYGEATSGPMLVEDDKIIQPLRKVVRIADDEDIGHLRENRQKEKEAVGIAQERIEKHGLEMKLVDVEYAFDGSRILFYFTANGRVDFRELVRDLASVFRTRIELRQIGVRDEAKMLGGLGPCGRSICCRQFLPDFQPVSIRMAKEQNLSLNPTKISGQCGRLMCCLKYEQESYEITRKQAPRLGSIVQTPDGTGVMLDVNVIREKVRVRVELPDGSFDVREFGFDQVSENKKANCTNSPCGNNCNNENVGGLADVPTVSPEEVIYDVPPLEDLPPDAPPLPPPPTEPPPYRPPRKPYQGRPYQGKRPQDKAPQDRRPPRRSDGRVNSHYPAEQSAGRQGRYPRNNPPTKPGTQNAKYHHEPNGE